MTATETELPLSQIKQLPELLMRAGGLDDETCENYAEAMREKANFPAILVVRLTEVAGDLPVGTLVCCDGHHRLRASRLAGRSKTIKATIKDGDLTAALLLAAASNDSHGRPRSRDDRIRSITSVLAIEQYKLASARTIADLCKVSITFASNTLKTVHGGQLPPSVGKDGKVRRQPKKAKRKPFNALREISAITRGIDRLLKRWPPTEPLTPLVGALNARVRGLGQPAEAAE